jgi:hypothetical protein
MKSSGVLIFTLSSVLLASCPLGFPPEEACQSDNPSCALFVDENGDGLCDNPGPQPVESSGQFEEFPSDSYEAVPNSVDTEQIPVTDNPVPLASGCPVGLPPEAACPSPDNSLCPHYMGLHGCMNPSGGGMRRTLIVLIATAVLLPTATILKRRMRGRGKKDRRKRKIVHITIQILSLLVLGFLVQGCFCPLGVIQYSLLPDGCIFLGGAGVAVLFLPMLWSSFFGRIYCGWVCPFGALQDLLGKLHVPRPPKFSSKVHSILSGFRYFLALLFFGLIILSSSGHFESFKSEAFFCRYDPFHTVFSFFIVGSFTGAIAAMTFLVFFPRFFCKYLCFYGAILSFLSRIELWKRLTRKHPSATQNDESNKPAAP